MKRKILIGLLIFFLVFLSSGFYIIGNIEHVTSSLGGLLMLHKVSLIRQQLLIEIRRTQLDLQLRNTPYAGNVDKMVTHVMALDETIHNCFECHHTAQVTARLDALQSSIDKYEDALSGVLTLRANGHQLAREQERAFQLGNQIGAEVDNINDLTIRKLHTTTTAALEENRRTKNFIYGILIAAPLLALGLSLAFLRWFTRPVAVLVNATRRLENGDLSHRIEGLHDEYGDVAASFNKMALSLKEHYEKMQWAEQVVILGELAGGLAHEIKNPLAGVKASLEVLSTDPTIIPENKDVLSKAAEQVRRMEGLIRNFMSFARPPAPQLADVDIHDVLDSAIGLLQRHPLFGRNRDGRITLVKDYQLPTPVLTADPAQLQQVFLNLVLNAAEAIPEGGTITVSTGCDPDGKSRFIRITDTGKGVDPVIREKIFQPFFTTKAKGTGLGLSISKRLVDQQGGTIRLEDHNGGGVSFVIHFPMPASAEVSDR
jgi:signal transduction histidine kinase